MKFKNEENENVKLEDGRTVWLSRACAVVNTVWCVVDGDARLLIGQRGPGSPDEVGKWNLPCGYLDWNETLKDASIREIWEETGVNVKDVKDENIIMNFMDYPWAINSTVDKGDKKQNVSIHHAIIFRADKFPELTDANSEPEEISDLKWIKNTEIDDFDYAFNHDKRIYEFINDHLQFALEFV